MSLVSNTNMLQFMAGLKMTLEIGQVSWAFAAGNGFSVSGRLLHCVKVASWKVFPTF